MKNRIELPDPINVANGSRFALHVPVGPTYDRINLELGGTFTPAMISNLTFKINGKAVRNYKTGQVLDDINAMYGRGTYDATNRQLAMWFYRPEMEEVEDANLFALGTNNQLLRKDQGGRPVNGLFVRTVTIEGDISGATSPTLKAWARVATETKPLLFVEKVLYMPYNAPAGEGDYPNIPRSPLSILTAAFLSSAADDITQVRITANVNGSQEEPYKMTNLRNDEELVNDGRALVATYFHIDLIPTGQFGEGLPLGVLQDLRIKPTKTTAANIDIHAEFYDTVVGL